MNKVCISSLKKKIVKIKLDILKLKSILVFFFRDLEGVAFGSGVRSHRLIFILKKYTQNNKTGIRLFTISKREGVCVKTSLKNENKSCLFS